MLPGRAEIGVAAPILLVVLRMLQGLAIGGEFGGAIVYVAEHAAADRRGLHTSWIPAMAMGGLLLSLAVIMAVRAAMTAGEFADWGWRVPFLLSAVLLVISLWIRLRLQESPVFRRMKEEQALSRAPLSEAFLHGPNCETHAGRAVRRGGRPGGHVLHGDVLRVLLPRAHRARGRRHDHGAHGRRHRDWRAAGARSQAG